MNSITDWPVRLPRRDSSRRAVTHTQGVPLNPPSAALRARPPALLCSETPGSFKTLRYGVCHTSLVDRDLCDSEFVLTVAEGEQYRVPGRDKERLGVTGSDSEKLGVRPMLQRPTANSSVLPTGHTPRAFGWPPVGRPRRRRFESSAPVSVQSVSKAESEPRLAPLHDCDDAPSALKSGTTMR